MVTRRIEKPDMAEERTPYPTRFDFTCKLAGSWPLQSDGNVRPDESTDDTIATACNGKRMVDIFAMNHDNLLSVLYFLMHYGTILAASKTFLTAADLYINTGNYVYADGEPVRINFMMVVSVGCVEKILIPAFQILYTFLSTMELQPEFDESFSGEDYTLDISVASDFETIDLFYKFNGQDVRMNMTKQQTTQQIILYIDN